MKNILALEPRLMFDGAALATIAETASSPDSAAASGSDGNDGGDTNNGINDANDAAQALADLAGPAHDANDALRQIAIIDGGIDGVDQILASIPAGTQVFMLDGSSDGVAQISDILAGQTDLSAVHLISHGDVGSINLGTTTVSISSLASYSTAIASWGDALSSTGDILLYGCNIGSDGAGRSFVESLSELTGADVAASDDLTGAAAQGGDWILEERTGGIEATALIADAFDGLLAARTATDGAGGDLELFLGGDFLEIGINKAGNFGTIAAKPDAFFGAGLASIGLVLDLDGFATGGTDRADFFVPGSPVTSWALGFNDGAANLSSSNTNSGSNAVTSVSETIAATVTNQSSGDTLAGRVTATYAAGGNGGSLGFQQDITFASGDKKYTTTITLTNNGAVDLTDVRYVWVIDPDNGKQIGGDFSTVNTLNSTVAAGDAKTVFSATALPALGKEANLIIETTEANIRFNHNVGPSGAIDAFAPTVWDTMSSKGDTATGDNRFTMTYRAASLAQGASVSFSIASSLTNQTVAEASGATTTTTTTTTTTLISNNSTPPPAPVTALPGGITGATGGASVTSGGLGGLGAGPVSGGIGGPIQTNDIGNSGTPVSAAASGFGPMQGGGLNTAAAVQGGLGAISAIERTGTPVQVAVNAFAGAPEGGLMGGSATSFGGGIDGGFGGASLSGDGGGVGFDGPDGGGDAPRLGGDGMGGEDLGNGLPLPLEGGGAPPSTGETNDQQGTTLNETGFGFARQLAAVYALPEVRGTTIALAFQNLGQ